MDLVGATLLVLIFSFLVHRTGLVEKTNEVAFIARSAAATLRDSALSDDDKERRVRAHSWQVFRLFRDLLLGTLLALLLPILLLAALQVFGLLSVDGVFSLFLRWPFVLAMTVVGIATYCVCVRWLKIRHS